ncbi:MAG: type I restriction-modification system subunit M [Acidimicrobiia bacterium]|nr:type I restriction-modification system subunit M [Acidimicrobiia bacterium]
MPGTSETARVGIPEIADFAGVKRTAVSNWRKRYSDFPDPAIDTPSGVLFDFAEVERWLIEKEKIAERVPISKILWQTLDALRGDLDVWEFGSLVNAALVYLEICDRAERRQVPRLAPGLSWTEIRGGDPSEVLAQLRSAAEHIEAGSPELEGLIVGGLRLRREPPPNVIIETIDLLDRMTRAEDTARFEMFEGARDHVHEVARFSGEHSTPTSLEYLLARLAANASSIFDPACGEGGALLLAALIDGREGPAPLLYGSERVLDACRISRTRFFLYDVVADIRCQDTLRAPMSIGDIQAVVLDPPYGQRDWGDADAYVSSRWRFGPPPPSSADTAWLQVAVEPLTKGGRAFVLLPSASLARAGREQQIRSRMIDAGVVESVVLLPARLRRDTSIPLALWCLRPQGTLEPDTAIMLVDASRLGSPGRSTISLEEHEVDALATIVQEWSETQTIGVADERIRAVAVSRGEIIEANLDPRKYQKSEEPGQDDLQASRLAALERFSAARSSASESLDRLLAELEVGR